MSPHKKKPAFRSFFISLSHSLSDLYEQIDFKMAVKMAITALLSFYLCAQVDRYLKHPLDLTTGLWCVLSSIVVLQYHIGGTYKAIWNRFLGVVLGSITGSCFAFVFGAQIESMGIAIFLTVILCSLLGIQDSYRIASLSVAIIMIPWKSHPTGDPWIYAFFRFFDTCLGFVVAIAVSHLVWPSQALTKMRLNMADIFMLFRQFFEHLVTSQQIPDKNDKRMEALTDEIDQIFSQSRAALEESKIELLMQFNPLGVWMELINCQERLWEHLRAMQETFNLTLEEVLDEKLKEQLQQSIEIIGLALQDLSLKLKMSPTHFDFNLVNQLKDSLIQERIRFRSTHAMKRYHLDIVENYYVFFYQIKQTLIALQQFNQLMDRLNVNQKS